MNQIIIWTVTTSCQPQSLGFTSIFLHFQSAAAGCSSVCQREWVYFPALLTVPPAPSPRSPASTAPSLIMNFIIEAGWQSCSLSRPCSSSSAQYLDPSGEAASHQRLSVPTGLVRVTPQRKRDVSAAGFDARRGDAARSLCHRRVVVAVPSSQGRVRSVPAALFIQSIWIPVVIIMPENEKNNKKKRNVCCGYSLYPLGEQRKKKKKRWLMQVKFNKVLQESRDPKRSSENTRCTELVQ